MEATRHVVSIRDKNRRGRAMGSGGKPFRGYVPSLTDRRVGARYKGRRGANHETPLYAEGNAGGPIVILGETPGIEDGRFRAR